MLYSLSLPVAAVAPRTPHMFFTCLHKQMMFILTVGVTIIGCDFMVEHVAMVLCFVYEVHLAQWYLALVKLKLCHFHLCGISLTLVNLSW